MTTDELRAKFEMFCKENHWCVNRQRNGDYKSMLIENMWIGYRAAYVSREDEVEALRKRINDAPVYYVPAKKPYSEEGWLQVIGSIKALNNMRGKHVRLVIDAAMREVE